MDAYGHPESWRKLRPPADPHRRRLLLRLEFLLNRFPVLWTGPSANPLRRYVQDLPDEVASDGDAMFGIIERRTFAVPEPGSRGDDTVQAPGEP